MVLNYEVDSLHLLVQSAEGSFVDSQSKQTVYHMVGMSALTLKTSGLSVKSEIIKLRLNRSAIS
jgi:hypothetical protein